MTCFHFIIHVKLDYFEVGFPWILGTGRVKAVVRAKEELRAEAKAGIGTEKWTRINMVSAAGAGEGTEIWARIHMIFGAGEGTWMVYRAGAVEGTEIWTGTWMVYQAGAEEGTEIWTRTGILLGAGTHSLIIDVNMMEWVMEKMGPEHHLRSRLCRDFSIGMCRRGDQCRFLHEENFNLRDEFKP